MTDSTQGPDTSKSPRCDVTVRDALTPRDRDEMFALFSDFFTARRDVFERDLDE